MVAHAPAWKRAKILSDSKQILSSFKIKPSLINLIRNKAVEGIEEQWETVFEKSDSESPFYGSDSKGIEIETLLFPKDQFVRQAGLDYKEAPEVLKVFHKRPVYANHNGIIIGFIESLRFDDYGMWGTIYIYPPVTNPNNIQYIRDIKADIMAGVLRQVSVGYDVKIHENGKARVYPTETSIVEAGKLGVGDFRRVSFSKKGQFFLFSFSFLSVFFCFVLFLFYFNFSFLNFY